LKQKGKPTDPVPKEDVKDSSLVQCQEHREHKKVVARLPKIKSDEVLSKDIRDVMLPP
jgi:hypothetical protein